MTSRWFSRYTWLAPSTAIALALLATPAATAAELAGEFAAPQADRADHAEAGSPRDADDSAADDKPSDAERIARLSRRIEMDRQRLVKLQAEINDPQSDYADAEQDFERLDVELENLEKQLQELKKAGRRIEAARRQGDLAELTKKWKLAEERFNLEIADRKAILEEIAGLEQKLAKDQEALDKLRGVPDDEPRPSLTHPSPDEARSGMRSPAGDRPHAAPDSEDAAPLPPLYTGGTANAAEGPEEMAADDEPASEEIVAANEELQEKEAEAQEAADEVRSIADRIAILTDSVATARTLLDTARKQADNADQTVRALDQEFADLLKSGGAQSELEELRARLAEAQGRVKEARTDARQRGDRLDELQTELAALQTEQIQALEEAEATQHEAEAARQKLDDLQNPFAPHNMLLWLIEHGPKILTILIAMAGFVWMSRILENRLVELMARRGHRGSVEDRENRAKTLVGVFRNAATLLIVAGGVLMIFDEVGIPVGPLMGGAAVVGLAVAFGAQSLIKDFFTGFMILLEQQFMVNDVVKIGDISGQVERISLRMTVLRDLEGRVHFIPHGQITSTTNLTHGWSRAVFDIGVAYKENVDRVMKVLLDIARDMRRDPEFGPLILEDAVMLGVDSLGDSAVTIKFYFKTRPLRQWPVKREMLRRIKNTFDQLGIEIPFPHQTVYQHHVPAADPGRQDPQDEWSSKQAA